MPANDYGDIVPVKRIAKEKSEDILAQVRRAPRQAYPTRRYHEKYLQEMLFYVNNRARAEMNVPGSMFRISKTGTFYLTPWFLNFVGYRTAFDFKQVVTRAAAMGATGVVGQVQALAVALKKATPGEKKVIRSANEQLAQLMRERLINTYAHSVEGRKQVPTYRVGQNRYSGGALKRAISNPDMVRVTDNGIEYINQTRLGIEARHWARLNFGVAPASTPSSFKGSVKFAGVTLGTVGFNAQPRPPMFLPAGFWNFVGGKIGGHAAPRVPNGKTHLRQYKTKFSVYDDASALGPGGGGRRIANLVSGSLDTASLKSKRGWGANHGSYTKSGVRQSRQGFYPLGGAPRYPTRGVVGVNYLDAGLEELVKQFPNVYSDLLGSLIQDAEGKGFPKSRGGTQAAAIIRAYLPEGSFVPRFQVPLVNGKNTTAFTSGIFNSSNMYKGPPKGGYGPAPT